MFSFLPTDISCGSNSSGTMRAVRRGFGVSASFVLQSSVQDSKDLDDPRFVENGSIAENLIRGKSTIKKRYPVHFILYSTMIISSDKIKI